MQGTTPLTRRKKPKTYICTSVGDKSNSDITKKTHKLLRVNVDQEVEH